MTMASNLFENERYVVNHSQEAGAVRSAGFDYFAAYNVVNKETDVVEYRVPQLPEAIAVAEQLDLAMTTQPWRASRSFHEGQLAEFDEVYPDGSLKKDEDPEVH